jgi:hypothetical protein
VNFVPYYHLAILTPMNMRKKTLTLFILSVCTCSLTTSAQLKKKDIMLDTNFISKADRMEVKMGWQVGNKLWNYKFGPYHLTENKVSVGATVESWNFLGTKSDFSSKSKFYFRLADAQNQSATVHGSIKNQITSTHALYISKHLGLGESALANSRRNFFGTISLDDDSVAWDILVIERSDSSWIGQMTYGSRKIDITRIMNYEDGKSPAFGISAGCQLSENGEIKGAVQYFGNRYNNNVIWILAATDAKEKMLLASALTALMASAHNGQEHLENTLDAQ